MFNEYTGWPGSAFFQNPCEGLISGPTAGVLPKGRLNTTINPIVMTALNVKEIMRMRATKICYTVKRYTL
jgi:hypothetical protein